ncbi:trehalose-phosphatase [Acinetobacter haemolyticus]|uniref:trehalose-phosphatase n=1 Tax=Acinetobacter haemolyticus TaxID=29430 RepID=UPI000F737C6E|nr:trehalose-phosphatase [Acinetobacter haemolyticus]
MNYNRENPNLHLEILENLLQDSNYKQNKKCLFLDIDGTLCDFKMDPNNCFIPNKTLNILENIRAKDIPVIAITGRDIVSARELFKFMDIPIAALHGLEIYLNREKKNTLQQNLHSISYIHSMISKACIPYPNLLIENKKCSVALHYRKCPELAFVAKKIINESHSLFPELKLIQGKFVFELISAEANKGFAIQKMLSHLNITDSVIPIFIGDDTTDEDGFIVVNKINKGISIKVGNGPTNAKYFLNDITQVQDFLALFLKNINEEESVLTTDNLSGEEICLD